MSELFDPILVAGPVADEVTDTAWLRGMLDFEAALAGAQADAGLIDRDHAEQIGRACTVEQYDLAELGRDATGIGNPAGPLVRALTERAGEQAGRFVHSGATSQDVVDTAAMLVSQRALVSLLAELDRCTDACAALAADHLDTVQVGRTLLQHALPVTFGLTAAGWLTALTTAAERLRSLRLPVQFGGAVGTLASLGPHGPAVLTGLSHRLGLAEPVLPWHTDRWPIADVAGALGAVAGVVAGVARSIVLLAQTDVAEVYEQGPPGSGGSSVMPHKRNPVAVVSALAGAKQAPGLVAGLLAAMEQEHQRAAGAWHAEWALLTQLWRVSGSAVHWLATGLQRLRVDPVRMRENLDRHAGVLGAERVTSELAPHVGRLPAHDAVTECCRRAQAGEGPPAAVMADDPLIGKYLSAARIEELLDPVDQLGSATVFVERALAAHRDRKEKT